MTYPPLSRRLIAGLFLTVAGALPVACSKAAPPAAAPPPATTATQPPSSQPAPEAKEPSDLPRTAEPAPAPAPPPVKWIVKTRYGPIVSDDPAAAGKKVAMLTFDDGPHPENTAKILEVLKANQVTALFFVTGNAARYEDVLRQVAEQGHLIGTHTLNHENLRFMTREQQRQAIVGVNETVERVTGRKPRYFRPPFGAYNDDTLALMQELEMQLINWDHGSGDWMDTRDGYKDPAIVIQDVLSEQPRNNQMTPLHPGSIILFHDTLRHTAEALPEIIKGLRELGYEFVTPEP